MMRIINYYAAGLIITLLLSCEERQQEDPRLDIIYELITNPELNVVSHEEIILSEKEVKIPKEIVENQEDKLEFLTLTLEEQDILFLQDQLRQRDLFTTSQLHEKGVTILSVDLLSQIPLKDFMKQRDIKGFYSVSMPIFNKEMTKAYIRLSYICEPLCGAGQELVLVKKNGEWKISRELGIWVN